MNLLLRFAAAVVVFVVWCVALNLAFTSSLSLLFVDSDPFSPFPFSSVHLGEEAFEGPYNPLHDAPFQSYLALMCLFVFLLGSYAVAWWLSNAALWLRLLPAAAPIAVMAMAMRGAFTPYAGSFRLAAIVALLLFVVSSVSGALLFSLRARHAV